MSSLRLFVVLALAGSAASVSDAAKSDGRIIALEKIVTTLGKKGDGEYCTANSDCLSDSCVSCAP